MSYNPSSFQDVRSYHTLCVRILCPRVPLPRPRRGRLDHEDPEARGKPVGVSGEVPLESSAVTQPTRQRGSDGSFEATAPVYGERSETVDLPSHPSVKTPYLESHDHFDWTQKGG